MHVVIHFTHLMKYFVWKCMPVARLVIFFISLFYTHIFILHTHFSLISLFLPSFSFSYLFWISFTLLFSPTYAYSLLPFLSPLSVFLFHSLFVLFLVIYPSYTPSISLYYFPLLFAFLFCHTALKNTFTNIYFGSKGQ